MKVILETLALEDDKGAMPLAELWLEGLMHSKRSPPKLYPQIGVSYCDLDLFPLEVEMTV